MTGIMLLGQREMGSKGGVDVNMTATTSFAPALLVNGRIPLVLSTWCGSGHIFVTTKSSYIWRTGILISWYWAGVVFGWAPVIILLRDSSFCRHLVWTKNLSWNDPEKGVTVLSLDCCPFGNTTKNLLMPTNSSNNFPCCCHVLIVMVAYILRIHGLL